MKTRNVERFKYKNYLTKAEEFYEATNDSYTHRRFNATVLNAVHCAISSADALTVFYKEQRHAGERHEDVVNLLNSLGLPDIQSKNRQLLALLAIKNGAEYEDRIMSESEAASAMKNAERFYKWVKDLLKT